MGGWNFPSAIVPRSDLPLPAHVVIRDDLTGSHPILRGILHGIYQCPLAMHEEASEARCMQGMQRKVFRPLVYFQCNLIFYLYSLLMSRNHLEAFLILCCLQNKWQLVARRRFLLHQKNDFHRRQRYQNINQNLDRLVIFRLIYLDAIYPSCRYGSLPH